MFLYRRYCVRCTSHAKYDEVPHEEVELSYSKGGVGDGL